jgi:hypothetical protein
MTDLLKAVGDRFHIPFTVIDLGSGTFPATVTETDQTSQPSFVFVRPRHVLRTPSPTALKPCMTIQSPYGDRFIVGENGPSDTWRGQLWDSFRVFEPTGQYAWTRRGKVQDPVTKQMRDTGVPQNMGTVWAAIESIDREASDREMRVFFEQDRFITGHPIQAGDALDNRQVSKVDKMLGLYIGILT